MSIHSIKNRGVNETFKDALYAVRVSGVEEPSRNGLVHTIPEPFLVTHTNPDERVIFCADRKENPYFHLMECIWMLAGDDMVDWIAQFNPRMREYAEDTGRIHGAYGHRWRHRFQVDQILDVVDLLSADPFTRRAVINMWSAQHDLGSEARDLPCNTQIYFRCIDDRLDMTVLNRSNDLIWGMLGSNVVHFSFLHEVIAHAVGLKLGHMHQFSNNVHVYERHWHFLDVPPHCQTYAELRVKPYPIVFDDVAGFLYDCENFVSGSPTQHKFFDDVIEPIFNSWTNKSPEILEDCQASDWRLACQRYLDRTAGG